MTRVYFVRHAQPEHTWKDDRTRPLTAEGKQDLKMVLDFLKDKEIDVFYSSPYQRSIGTIADAAAFYGKEILTDERLREREKGCNGNNYGMFEKRWANHDYHEENGESINMVQKRNIEALTEILAENKGRKIVIGTHGTALSTILNYYDAAFECKDFLRIIDWMPYIIELDFDGEKLLSIKEHCYIEKEFQGKNRADKKGLMTADRCFGDFRQKVRTTNQLTDDVATAMGAPLYEKYGFVKMQGEMELPISGQGGKGNAESR